MNAMKASKAFQHRLNPVAATLRVARRDAQAVGIPKEEFDDINQSLLRLREGNISRPRWTTSLIEKRVNIVRDAFLTQDRVSRAAGRPFHSYKGALIAERGVGCIDEAVLRRNSAEHVGHGTELDVGTAPVERLKRLQRSRGKSAQVSLGGSTDPWHVDGAVHPWGGRACAASDVVRDQIECGTSLEGDEAAKTAAPVSPLLASAPEFMPDSCTRAFHMQFGALHVCLRTLQWWVCAYYCCLVSAGLSDTGDGNWAGLRGIRT